MILNHARSRIFTRALSVTTKQCLEHQQAEKKLLKVALIGAPNAGKSTLLNRLVDSDVSSVSKRVHTTRGNVLGVYTQEDTQIEFYDTPGLVTRQHLLRHHLEDRMLFDPRKAVFKCDLIAVVVDASNTREQLRLNKGIVSLLEMHQDKESVLILNKVDLVKDKRNLIDIGIRLTQGYLGGQPTLKYSEIKKMPGKRVKDLNLISHLQPHEIEKYDELEVARPPHKYVIDLDKIKENAEESDYYYDDEEPKSTLDSLDQVSHRHFSDIFSISALQDDGVTELRDHLLSRAMPVERWSYGPDFLTNKSSRELIHEVIRGKVLDYVPGHLGYVVKYKYLRCAYDDLGSMHVNLQINCPDSYMVPRILGERGVHIFRIIEDSRDMISKILNCDVKLSIVVNSPEDKRRGI